MTRYLLTRPAWASVFAWWDSTQLPVGSLLDSETNPEELAERRSDMNVDGMDVPASVDCMWIRPDGKKSLQVSVTVDDLRERATPVAEVVSE